MMMALSGIAGKVVRKLRHNGLVDWVFLDRKLLICCGGRDAMPGGPEDGRVSKNATAHMDSVARLRPDSDASRAGQELRANLDKGDEMFTAEVDGEIAGVGWSSPLQREARFPYVGQRLDFGQFRVTTLFSAYVSPAFRRRGIYRSLFNARIRDAFDAHQSELVVCAEEGGNASARKAHEVLGLEVIGYFHLTRRLGREQCHFVAEPNSLGVTLTLIRPGLWKLQRTEDGDASHTRS